MSTPFWIVLITSFALAVLGGMLDGWSRRNGPSRRWMERRYSSLPNWIQVAVLVPAAGVIVVFCAAFLVCIAFGIILVVGWILPWQCGVLYGS